MVGLHKPITNPPCHGTRNYKIRMHDLKTSNSTDLERTHAKMQMIICRMHTQNLENCSRILRMHICMQKSRVCVLKNCNFQYMYKGTNTLVRLSGLHVNDDVKPSIGS